jgi:hypothetical protein
MYTSHIKQIECLNASSRIAFSSLIKVCCINETVSNLVPFNAIFNLGNKKELADAESVEYGGWANTTISRFAKNSETTAEERGALSCAFLKLGSNATNSSGCSLNHFFMKFTVYSVSLAKISDELYL